MRRAAMGQHALMRLARPAWVAVAAIAGLSVMVDGFGPDDTQLFTYVNNAVGASPWVTSGGYVHLIPNLIAAVLAPASLPLQMIGYRLAALLSTLVLFRELRALFLPAGNAREAAALALGVVLVMAGVDATMLANLSWVNWTACLAATTYLLRIAGTNAALTPAAFIGVALGLLTTPIGLLLAPVCAWHARRESGHRRSSLFVMAVLLVAWHGFQISISPESAHLAGLTAIATLRNHLYDAVPIITTALLVLSILTIDSWRRASSQDIDRSWSDATLFYLAAASTVTFVSSSRLTEQGFETRYLLVPVYAAAVAAARRVLRIRSLAARPVAVAVSLALALVLPTQLVLEKRRGPLALWFAKYRFLQSAVEFRERCSDDDVMVFEDEPSSAVVLCRPRALAPGVYPVVDFQPAVGEYDVNTPLSRRPAIEIPHRVSIAR